MGDTASGNPKSVVSLFSGCGGLDLGFRGGFDFGGRHYARHPFEIVWANDINAAACRTYERNLGAEIQEGDIWDVIDTLPSSADVVLGGFPCQDVSINGLGQAEAGTRTILYRALLEVIRQLQPCAFVAENVKGLLLPGRQAFFDAMMDEFNSLPGYSISHQLYMAADYGVPQMRERILIVGLKGDDPFEHPKPIGGAWMTAQEAVGDLEDAPEDRAINHIWSKAQISPEQGNRRINPERPSPTIRAECHGNSPFHYSLNRRISMREAARFQSFPDDFIFEAGLRQTERQVGNAVPPVLAWHVASAVARQVS